MEMVVDLNGRVSQVSELWQSEKRQQIKERENRREIEQEIEVEEEETH